MFFIQFLLGIFSKKANQPYSQEIAQINRRKMIRNPITGKQTKKGG